MKLAMNTSPDLEPIRDENNVEEDLRELAKLIETSNELIASLQEEISSTENTLEDLEEKHVTLFRKLSEENAQLASLLEREAQLKQELKKFETGHILTEAVVRPSDTNFVELLPNYNKDGYARIMSSFTKEGLADALKGLLEEEKRLDKEIVGANANDLDQLSSKLLVVKDKIVIVKNLLHEGQSGKQGKILRA